MRHVRQQPPRTATRELTVAFTSWITRRGVADEAVGLPSPHEWLMLMVVFLSKKHRCTMNWDSCTCSVTLGADVDCQALLAEFLTSGARCLRLAVVGLWMYGSALSAASHRERIRWILLNHSKAK